LFDGIAPADELLIETTGLFPISPGMKSNPIRFGFIHFVANLFDVCWSAAIALVIGTLSKFFFWTVSSLRPPLTVHRVVLMEEKSHDPAGSCDHLALVYKADRVIGINI
jgi:hypothetical protein